MLLTNELVLLTVLCLIGTQGKPSLSFNLHPFTVFNGFGSMREDREVVKRYSGHRVSNDSVRMVYFHEQTVAIVELGPKKLLMNCEFIEAYKDDDAIKLLKDLTRISRPLHINFDEMMTLMAQCAEVETYEAHTTTVPTAGTGGSGSGAIGGGGSSSRGLVSNPFSLLSGIIPGTKWCGTGDIAEDYHDLGSEADVDRCCRAHDLCPVKVRGYMKRYNITNVSYYTKTHCQCDDRLYACLKMNASPTAAFLGQVYFNLVQVPCVDEADEGGRVFRPARRNF